MERTGRVVLFDFDGTLCRLATDYDRLRARLGGDSGLLAAILRSGAHDEADEAELQGLRSGEAVERGVELYRELAARGPVAVVSHNGRAVVERFLHERRLPEPDTILDRRALGAPKQDSAAVTAYLHGRAALVVGDAESDRALAERLGAEYVDIGDERATARLLRR